MATKNIITAGTATGATRGYVLDGMEDTYDSVRTFQASGTTSSGTGSVTVNVEVSNDLSNWIVLGTISLSLSTTSATDGFTAEGPWTWVRGNVTAISGTGAAVTLNMGA